MSLKVFVLKPRKDLEISVAVSLDDAEIYEEVLRGLIMCLGIADTLLETATAETPKELIAAAEAAIKKVRGEG